MKTDNAKKANRAKAIDELFLRDVTPEMPSDWSQNLEDKPLPPPACDDVQPKPLTPMEKGGICGTEWTDANFRHNYDGFLATVAPILSWMQSGETLDLRDPLWADFVKAKFAFDPNLNFPDEFEVLDGEVEMWERGFQKHLRNFWEQAKYWSEKKCWN